VRQNGLTWSNNQPKTAICVPGEMQQAQGECNRHKVNATAQGELKKKQTNYHQAICTA
jgi:hypothetical protein